jgi:hypothetical protein
MHTPSVAARYASGRSAAAQVKAVFIKQENRAQHSLTVGFDQAGDTRQNIVQGCAYEHHLQRIQYRLARQGLRRGPAMF